MRKSEKRRRRREARAVFALVLCALVMLANLGYMLSYEHTRRSILRSNAAYSALYVPAPTSLPATEAPVTEVPATVIPATEVPATVAPATAAPVTEFPVTVAPATAAPVTATPAPAPSFAAVVDATREPRATADADTVVIAMPTTPPVQDSFLPLLEANPEAVGYLNIEGVLSLPVAQRANDNEFYLDHDFAGQESVGGALFLDGANLLSPADDCLIVYGHNMKNGTMFRPLIGYEDPAFVREHPLARFDTLYENRCYVPFAALSVTADPGSERYLNLRQFSFDEAGFGRFVASLRKLSVWDSPVEVKWGDRVLLLVTCEYTHENGRFVLAMRAEREGESEPELLMQVLNTN